MALKHSESAIKGPRELFHTNEGRKGSQCGYSLSQDQQHNKFFEALAMFGRTYFLKGVKLYPEAAYYLAPPGPV
jgi:hypothetical protein